MRWSIAIALASVPCVLMIAASSPAHAKGGIGCAITVSGGDLPHPVTIPEDDCANVLDGSAHSSTALTKAPDVTGVTGYKLGSAEGENGNIYYPRPDGVGVELCSGCDPAHRWTADDPSFDRLYRRFIALARAGLIGEHPTWADALAASGRLWPVVIDIDRPTQSLTGDDAERFLAELAAAQPVRVGIRSKSGGPPSVSWLKLSQIVVRFGDADELTFSASAPGELADSALLFSSTGLSATELYSIIPPAVVKNAYAATPALDDWLRLQAVPDMRTSREVRMVEVTGILSHGVRMIDSISTTDGQAPRKLEPSVPPEYAYSYLATTSGSPQHEGRPVSLTFHIMTSYNPFPEAFPDVRADYYPRTGLALTWGETIGNGRLVPGWVQLNSDFARVVDAIVERSNSSNDASRGFGARLPFVLVAFGAVIALAMVWLSTYLNSRKTARAEPPASRS